MSEHLLLSIAVSGPPLALRLIHLPPLPIEARRETSAAIFWQLLMDAGNTNERFNDSQAVLVSAMIAYMFSIYQRKFAPGKPKTLVEKKCNKFGANSRNTGLNLNILLSCILNQLKETSFISSFR